MNDEIKIEKDMTPKLIGETYMKYPTETSQQRYRYGLYECQYCGKEFEAITKDIKKGHTKSCGCQKGGITHGLRNNKFYKTWNDMIRRCTNHKATGYKNYGGRGITVCDEWLDVTNFVAWCEETYPNIKGYSLDRIDNDKGYSPENCRWADRATQNINQRKSSANTSGFVGVYWDISKNKWTAKVGSNNKLINIGAFKTKEEAVQARDNYITQNKLPHKLSGLTKNIKENKWQNIQE